ncbi:hypothetical protein ACFY2M_17750 [Streptomyces sp. NPDC001276]|uniref:hypothetical protein n=1 Tax=Streptomyces sp. NPDC001276 TaxID=3364555 RepID=UPI0036C3109F
MNSTNAADTSLRGLGACCAVANAVLHTLLIPDHLEEKFYIGVLFAVGSAVMLAVALALAITKRPLAAWLTGALVSLGMIMHSRSCSRSITPAGDRSMRPPPAALSAR